MFRQLSFLLLLLASFDCLAASTVTVPWEEFKDLYAERLRAELESQAPEAPPAVYTIEEAVYQLVLAENGVSGRVTLRGQVLAGKPEPLDLFERGVAITGVDEMQGGTLISAEDGYRLYVGAGESFQLAFTIIAPVQEDQRSRFVAFRIPQAVKNELQLTVANGLRVLEAPGLRPGQGGYYFSPSQELRLRFAALGQTAAAPAVDTFTRIELSGNRYGFTAFFMPVQALSGPLKIRFQGARFVGSSLKPSWVKEADDDELIVTLPDDWQQPFTLQYERDAVTGEIVLPGIEGNQGREGEFQIREPVEARISAIAEGLQRDLPVSRLPAALRRFVQATGSYSRSAENAVLELDVLRFEAVSAPEIVLDTINFYLSFTENGSALSVLRLELPPDTGQKLALKPIPGAEIWSLSVNNEARSLYRQGEDSWIIPLAAEGASIVELAYLQKGDKLGLKGRLALSMPETGLAARRVDVAIALPERIELVALEGELEPAKGKTWPRVQGFAGKPYYFSHPFYRGEALDAAIFYKEPIDERTSS